MYQNEIDLRFHYFETQYILTRTIWAKKKKKQPYYNLESTFKIHITISFLELIKNCNNY